MTRKTIANHGAGRSTETDERGFTRGPNVQPGRPSRGKPPDPGELQQPRQSGTGRKPPQGQEKSRPRDTGRSGA
jgi:hypothetical protein